MTDKTFRIPVKWELSGVLEIKAKSLEGAVRKALHPHTPFPHGEYVPCSFAVCSNQIASLNKDLPNEVGTQVEKIIKRDF